jgi:hypothetical protein
MDREDDFGRWSLFEITLIGHNYSYYWGVIISASQAGGCNRSLQRRERPHVVCPTQRQSSFERRASADLRREAGILWTIAYNLYRLKAHFIKRVVILGLILATIFAIFMVLNKTTANIRVRLRIPISFIISLSIPQPWNFQHQNLGDFWIVVVLIAIWQLFI